MSYHPIVKEPKLALKGYNSNTTNEQDIANELQGCLPLRIRLNYDSEDVEANVEFKMLESAEKAFTLYRNLRFSDKNIELLPYDDNNNLITHIPQSISTPKIFRNLPTTITPDAVYNLTRLYGPIHSIRMINAGVAVVEAWDEDTANNLESEMHCSDVDGQLISVTTYIPPHTNELQPKASAFVPQHQKKHGLVTPLPNSPGSYFGHGPGQQVQYTGTNLVDPCNLFVKNLDQSLESNNLFDHFKSYGHIVSARVMRDENDNSRGFGFVSYQFPESAKTALHAMNGVTIGSKSITVRFHEPKQLRQEKLAAKFAKSGDRLTPSLGLQTPISPVPSDYGGMDNYLTSPPLSTTPLGQRRGSGSYFKAALGAEVIPSLEEFKAMTLPMRNEILAGHMARILSQNGLGEMEVIDKLLINNKLEDLVILLNDNDALIERSQQVQQEMNNLNVGLNALRIDQGGASRAGSMISQSGYISQQSEKERLIMSVQNLGEPDSEKIGEMLNSLGKKERALCLFSNDYLIQKVRDARVLMEAMEGDDDEVKPEMKTEENQNMTAAEVLEKAIKEKTIYDDELYKQTVDYYNSLAHLEVKTQKQKIGESLFKQIKLNGFKSNIAKLTIKILDNEDLKSLILLIKIYPEYLNLIICKY
ncbi:hypothetical protein E3Q16_01328 [Wallemia mellicola]|nr:hypothetical protein E3Q16_01328 [Wallemia mellicola]